MNAIDPALYKFVSIIKSSNQLKSLCDKRKIGTWFKKLDAEVDRSKYDVWVQSFLRIQPELSQKEVKKRKKIGLVYARILAQYIPQNDGSLHPAINYYELVIAIKKVFRRHICKTEALFTSGIEVAVENKPFLAKVEKKRIYIIPREATLIGSGGFGKVFEVFEIASAQYFAFKKAFEPKGIAAIGKEISNLNRLHDRAVEMNLSTSGLQDRPLATFNIESGLECVGFISPKYGIELNKWLLNDPTNAERVAMCKSMMIAYKNKAHLGLWHGDLKLPNILIHNQGCVIIDWAGFVFFQDTLDHAVVPAMYTSTCINFSDKILQRELREVLKVNKDELLKLKFLELSTAMEVFSMGVVLYVTLTSKDPYYLIADSNLKVFCDASWSFADNSLFARKYKAEVVEAVTKMLTADYKNRYTAKDAIEIWEKI